MTCTTTRLPKVIASGTVVGTSASPGFVYGRPGDVGAGTYLLVMGGVPSNTAGNIVPFDGTITRAFVTSENADTFTVKIQSRSGIVFTDIGTLTVTASRKEDFDITIPVTDGTEVVCKIDTGNCRNVQVGLIIEQNP